MFIILFKIHGCVYILVTAKCHKRYSTKLIAPLLFRAIYAFLI